MIKGRSQITEWIYHMNMWCSGSNQSKRTGVSDINSMNTLIFFLTCIVLSGTINAQRTFSKADLDSIVVQAKRSDFSGCIYILKGAQELLHFNNGSINDEHVLPTVNTRFNIGSNGKTMTAVLIMQLVAQNKLQLDIPVSTYLRVQDSFPNMDKITIKQLLTMTSGLGDFFDSPDYNEEHTLSIDDHLRLVQKMKLVDDIPGKKFSYSNSGFIILGKILELQYGKPYQKIVEERILKPAHINLHSGSENATGYKFENNKWTKGEANDPKRWTSAGGIFLSARELNQYLTSVLQNKYLPEQVRDLMWTGFSHPDDDPPFEQYGLGWMVENPFGINLIGHNGGVRGFQAAFRYLPQENIFIYVLSNHDDGANQIFMNMIMMLVQKK